MKDGVRRLRIVNLILAAVLATGLGLTGRGIGRAQSPAEQDDRVAAATVLVVALVLQLEDGVPTREYWRVPLGSGVIVSDDGLILTNSHVIDLTALQSDVETEENTQGIDLEIEDAFLVYAVEGTEDDPSPRYSATTVANRPTFDLAVLAIDGNERGLPLRHPVGEDRPPLTFGEPASVAPREPVRIFGYPVFGRSDFTAIGTTTIDVIDGRIRSLETGPGIRDIRLLHIDATVSSGSSGGAVVDQRGRLIGIVSEARGGAVGGSEAIAIPIDRARPVLVEAGWTDPHLASAPPESAASKRGTPVTPAETETYVSPTYGYTLSYDPSLWSIGHAAESDGTYDFLGLQTNATEILFGGFPTHRDAKACVTSLLQLTAGETDVVAAEPMLTADGTPIEGGDANDAYGAFLLTRGKENESSHRQQMFYVRCIVLESGVSMLGIQQWSAPAVFDLATQQRDELLTGLGLP